MASLILKYLKKRRFLSIAYIGCPIKNVLCLKNHHRQSFRGFSMKFSQNIVKTLKILKKHFFLENTPFLINDTPLKLTQILQKSDFGV